eukprot:m.176032 g.176032  ORF g.176032 m.176032 type:complete len:59 (-) comp15434_c0_seq30:2064-2240(-)
MHCSYDISRHTCKKDTYQGSEAVLNKAEHLDELEARPDATEVQVETAKEHENYNQECR